MSQGISLLHADELCVGAQLACIDAKNFVTKGQLGDGRADRCNFARQFGSGDPPSGRSRPV